MVDADPRDLVAAVLQREPDRLLVLLQSLVLTQPRGDLRDGDLVEVVEALAPAEDDLGTLSGTEGFAYPAYYTFDYHRQAGGVWRSDAGAAIYLLGARIVHVGRNSDFQLHDQFVDEIEVDAPPREILDLGCGFGKTTFSLKRRWPEARVEGIDLSEPCLKLGRKMATDRGLEIDWRQADIERLPHADDSVDLAVITMVLHEMPQSAIRGAFAEAARVLRSDGVLYVMEPLAEGPYFELVRPVEDETEIRAEAYRAVLRAADGGTFV